MCYQSFCDSTGYYFTWYRTELYYIISTLIRKSVWYFCLSGAQYYPSADRQNEIILFEVLLPAHFLLLHSYHLCLSLPLTIYDEEISGQSKLTAKCSLSYVCASTLPVLPALKQATERRPSSCKPDLCWTPSIIYRFSRRCGEMHGQISSLLALNPFPPRASHTYTQGMKA